MLKTKSSDISRLYRSRKDRRSVALKEVVKWLNTELSKIYISDRPFELLKKRLYTLWLEKEKGFKKLRKAQDEKVTKFEAPLSSLKRKNLNPDTPEAEKADLPYTINAVLDDLRDMEDQKNELRERHEEDFELAWQKLQVLRDAKTILGESDSLEPKKAIFLSVCSNLTLYPKKIEVEWKEPFDSIVKQDTGKHKKPALRPILLIKVVLAPGVGIEPTTNWLTANCSTAELPGTSSSVTAYVS